MAVAEYFYTYGDDGEQDVNDAQAAIVAALDLLIEEMRQYMRFTEQVLSSHETDEFQARVEQHLKQVSCQPSNDSPKRDFEASKQKIRDDNTIELGGMEKRLRELLQRREIFANTAPKQVPRTKVEETYRVFKLQILRHVQVLGTGVPDKTSLDHHMHIKAYGEAMFACGCLDEVYPFADAKF